MLRPGRCATIALRLAALSSACSDNGESETNSATTDGNGGESGAMPSRAEPDAAPEPSPAPGLQDAPEPSEPDPSQAAGGSGPSGGRSAGQAAAGSGPEVVSPPTGNGLCGAVQGQLFVGERFTWDGSCNCSRSALEE
jgi:hypothetical protein